VARPTGGLVDFASGTFDSVKRVTEVTQEVRRVRPPRFLTADGVVRHYDKKAAEGAQYLRELEKGKYEKEGDVYVEHEAVVNKQDATQRAKEVFLVSSKRVVYITYHQVLGNWAVEWEFLYKELSKSEPPTVEKDATDDSWHLIVRPMEVRRKVLGLFGGMSGKRIDMPSKHAAQNMARIILQLQRDNTATI